MPDLQKTSPVVAILVSDIHLSHKPPRARASEPDWYAAMQRPLDELRNLAATYNCPIVCAGDVFDRWNPPPELLNFAIESLPKMWAVPGQHDLPFHRYEDLHKTAYWTMVQAGIITNLSPGIRYWASSRLALYGFPWGVDVTPCEQHVDCDEIHMAVIHSYIWETASNSYPGAPREKNVRNKEYAAILRTYDVAHFGDNHKPVFVEL